MQLPLRHFLISLTLEIMRRIFFFMLGRVASQRPMHLPARMLGLLALCFVLANSARTSRALQQPAAEEEAAISSASPFQPDQPPSPPAPFPNFPPSPPTPSSPNAPQDLPFSGASSDAPRECYCIQVNSTHFTLQCFLRLVDPWKCTKDALFVSQ